MANPAAMQAELEALHTELITVAAESAPPAADAAPAQSAASAGMVHEYERILGELHQLLSATKAAGKDVEETISEHPLIAVASALLLGIAIGRLLGFGR